VVETDQELGIALTTDAPTRYVVPDNRISLASSSTDTPSSSLGTTHRTTLDTLVSSSRDRSLPSRVEGNKEDPIVMSSSQSIGVPPDSSRPAPPQQIIHSSSITNGVWHDRRSSIVRGIVGRFVGSSKNRNRVDPSTQHVQEIVR
jgi:hypothetical protein